MIVSLPSRPRPGDIIAGVTVVLALIPQGLAYAELAGLPPAIGLVAGTIPPIIAALFASSPYLQTGPTALTSLLVAGALAPLAVADSPHYVALAALLALMIGVIRVALGLARLGVAAYFVSQPVLTGFTTGAALLIVGSQIPAILGVDAEGTRVTARAFDALSRPGDWNSGAIVVAVVTGAVILLGRRINPLVPGVAVGVGAGWLLADARSFDIARVGEVLGATVRPSLDLPWGDVPSLLVPAAVVALIGFAEPAAIARTFAATERMRWDADREFVSQGAANLASGVIGGFPVGGSFGRSALNHRAGAVTAWSGAITGAAMLLLLPFVGAVANLPKAALAAVVITAVSSLLRPRQFADLWAWSRPQTLAAAVTAAATLALDPRIERGLLVGIGLSVAIHLWRELKVGVDTEVGERDGRPVVHLRPHGVLWFGSADRVVTLIADEVSCHTDASQFDIDLSGIGRLDLTAAVALAELANDIRRSGEVMVCFVAIPEHAQRLFSRVLDPAACEPATEAP